MNNENMNNLPDTIEFGEDETSALGRQPQLPAGTFRFVITDAERSVSQKGHLMLIWTCAPLGDPSDSESPVYKFKTKHFVVLDKRNPKIQGHQAPGTYRMNVEAIRAIYPEVPDTAHKDNGGRLCLDGDPCSREEAATRSELVKGQVIKLLAAAYNKPEEVVGKTFWATAELRDNGYIGLNKLRSVLGTNEEATAVPGFDNAPF